MPSQGEQTFISVACDLKRAGSVLDHRKLHGGDALLKRHHLGVGQTGFQARITAEFCLFSNTEEAVTGVPSRELAPGSQPVG